MSPRHVLPALGATCALAACGGEISAPRDPFDAPLASLSAGVLHTCGVTATGVAYCWGWNRDGQVGDRSRTDRPFPVRVVGGLGFRSLSGGGAHTCGIETSGNAYCWGFNLNGQLGSAGGSATAPAPVSGGLGFTGLEAGGSFGCGLTAADSASYCWGWNNAGQVGDGSRGTDRASPVRVVGGLKGRAVRAGGTSHACILAADSTAHCWGANDAGELGRGTLGDTATSPGPVSGGLKFTHLTLGYRHTCGLTAAGAAFCWGDNTQGQLGDTVGSTTTPHAVAGTLTFTSLDAGAAFTCGVATGGAAYCWGANDSGQLGTAQTPLCDVSGVPVPCSFLPVAVSGGLRFAAVTAGTRHACGLTTGDVAYCWGLNAQGQLGDGSRRTTATPVRVAGQAP